MTQHLSPEQIRANARYAERSTGISPEFEAKMLAVVTPLIESGAIIKRSDTPPKPFASWSTRCSTEGHEYNFGVCLDCGSIDEAYEPTDAQIPGAYEIQKKAA